MVRSSRVSFVVMSSFLAVACGGAPSTPDAPAIPTEVQAAAATQLEGFGPYTIAVEDGSGGTPWYEAESTATVDLYFAPDGSMPKFEVQVPFDLLPAPVRDAGRGELSAGDSLLGAELVYLNGQLLFEIEILAADGTKRDLYFDPTGSPATGY
jgi:hypothetical protein